MRQRKRLILCLIVLLCVLLGAVSARADYQSLCSQNGIDNANLIAWLEIPGAGMTEAVMRHPDDDAYYTRYDAKNSENVWGSLYVQAGYNTGDFTDPVMLVYGSSASQAAPLYMLQELYSGSFDSCRQMFLHLPQGTIEYEVFAALPYESLHILHYYDFSDARRYNHFFNSVFSTRALGMHLDENKWPEAGKDRVLILSTGLRGDSLQRYLVMAKPVTP